MMVTITQVPNRLVNKIWDQCVPHFEKGRRYWQTHYDLEDFRRDCIEGKMQLWIQVIDKKIVTVMLTSLINYPKCIYLRYIYMGGSHLRVAKDYVYIVENWAKSHGAIGFEILGRTGWSAFVDKAKMNINKNRVDSAIWLSAEFED